MGRPSFYCLIHFYKSIFRLNNWTIAWGRAGIMGDQHQKQERIPNPDLENKEVEEKVEELEELEGETLSMRFLALAVSNTVSPSIRSRHTELTRRRSRSLEESLATIKRKKTCKTRKSLLRRSKLGESLMKMQRRPPCPPRSPPPRSSRRPRPGRPWTAPRCSVGSSQPAWTTSPA